MTIIFEKEHDMELGVDYENVAEKVINAALDYENCPYETEISITLTDDGGIREINREFRQTDRPTDVLSFPMVDYTSPSDFDFLENEEEYFNPESGELMLGDIVISLDRVKSQAEEYGHTCLREYAFLITHSMLHLMGYDHMEPDDAQEMERRQEDILNILGIGR